MIQRCHRARRLQVGVRRIIVAKRRRVAVIRLQKWVRGTQVRRRYRGRGGSKSQADEDEDKLNMSEDQDASDQESRDATHSLAMRLSKLEAHADMWQEDLARSVDLIMSHLGVPHEPPSPRSPSAMRL